MFSLQRFKRTEWKRIGENGKERGGEGRQECKTETKEMSEETSSSSNHTQISFLERRNHNSRSVFQEEKTEINNPQKHFFLPSLPPPSLVTKRYNQIQNRTGRTTIPYI